MVDPHAGARAHAQVAFVDDDFDVAGAREALDRLERIVGAVVVDDDQLVAAVIEILVERVALSDGRLPATILRLPMVYGPGAREAVKRRACAI